MGILVTLAIFWLALMVTVALVYSIGPPAQRVRGVRKEVEAAVEEIRRQAALPREQALHDLRKADWPIDVAIASYQQQRRGVLPGAADHRWGATELREWGKRETTERGRSLRQRNLFSLIAWNLAITVVLATTAWLYYQNVQSKARPQMYIPSASQHPHP